MTKRLTLKQQRFIEAYLANDGNATQSYREAYGEKSGNTMSVNGHQLLKNTKILTTIEQRRAEIMEASTIRIEHKRLALWEIATKAREEGDPQIAIEAIAELNKMDGSYKHCPRNDP